MRKQTIPSEISNHQTPPWCAPLSFIMWKSCQTLNHLDELASFTWVASNMNCAVPLEDTLHLDIAFDLVLLTQSNDLASFPLKCVYEKQFIFNLVQIEHWFIFLFRSFIDPPSQFIHKTKNLKKYCIFPLAWLIGNITYNTPKPCKGSVNS